jgi:hypothetical protein
MDSYRQCHIVITKWLSSTYRKLKKKIVKSAHNRRCTSSICIQTLCKVWIILIEHCWSFRLHQLGTVHIVFVDMHLLLWTVLTNVFLHVKLVIFFITITCVIWNSKCSINIIQTLHSRCIVFIEKCISGWGGLAHGKFYSKLFFYSVYILLEIIFQAILSKHI